MKNILNEELQKLAVTYINKEDQIALSGVLGVSVPKIKDILTGRAYCTEEQVDKIQGFIVMRHKLAALKVNQIGKKSEPCP